MEPWERHYHKGPDGRYVYHHIAVWLPLSGPQYAPILSWDDRPFMAARDCQRRWGACGGIIEVFDMAGNLVSRWRVTSARKLERLD